MQFCGSSQHRALTCSCTYVYITVLWLQGYRVESRVNFFVWSCFIFFSVNMYCIYSRLYMDGCIIKKSTFQIPFSFQREKKKDWFEQKTWAEGKKMKMGFGFEFVRLRRWLLGCFMMMGGMKQGRKNVVYWYENKIFFFLKEVDLTIVLATKSI